MQTAFCSSRLTEDKIRGRGCGLSTSSEKIARVSNAGSINTFDITPDGTRIVFDRVEERSNLVLIERPQ